MFRYTEKQLMAHAWMWTWEKDVLNTPAAEHIDAEDIDAIEEAVCRLAYDMDDTYGDQFATNVLVAVGL